MHIRGHDIETVCPAELEPGSRERLLFARERQRHFFTCLPETIEVDGVIFEKQWRDRGADQGGSPAYHAPRANLTVGLCIRDDAVCTPETIAEILETNREYFHRLLLTVAVR